MTSSKTILARLAVFCLALSALSCSRKGTPEHSTEAVASSETFAKSKAKDEDQGESKVVRKALDGVPGAQSALYNREAVVPPMCYTKTEGKHNPCYVCHQKEVRGEGRANFLNDGYLQGDYNFSEVALDNHWKNLFEDRSAAVAAISDEEIDTWVAQDNYSGLSKRLKDTKFEGWIPDLEDLEKAAAAFDEFGFAKDGSGWVAFNYKPLPSTFWPTNGATDDVMVRLPDAFRTLSNGTPSRDVYLANLSLVELTIKSVSELSTPPINEQNVGVDLDGDEKLAMADKVVKRKHYVGAASDVKAEVYLYPLETEFLHTVRYVAVNGENEVGISTRMKEVRYMRKTRQMRKDVIAKVYDDERKEKQKNLLPRYSDFRDKGVMNKFKWLVAGFIEDGEGELRPQTYEENLFCMGCHNSVGTTIDQTFAFPRKVDGKDGWKYIDLRGMPDAPTLGEKQGEIVTYLERVGGGSEFRANPEMDNKWFSSGKPDPNKLARAKDVYDLITPSPKRARELNKAYLVLVRKQQFIHGRDPTTTPPKNVFNRVDPETTPLPKERHFTYDIRLSWQNEETSSKSANKPL